jgi:hypothetical protein
MKLLSLLALAVAGVLAASASAHPASTTPSISINQGLSDLRYGGHATVEYQLPKLRGGEVVEIVVTAYQNANGTPNTDPGGPDIVYAWTYENLASAGELQAGLPEPGTQSVWSLAGGGAAVARIDLVEYSKSGHTVLATTGDFSVAA